MSTFWNVRHTVLTLLLTKKNRHDKKKKSTFEKDSELPINLESPLEFPDFEMHTSFFDNISCSFLQAVKN